MREQLPGLTTRPHYRKGADAIMARDHARIYTAIWENQDWLKLDPLAQHAYWMLMSQKDISYCGVLDYVPGRLTKFADGLTAARIRTVVRSLERAKFVVVDRDTQELLIRSFIRHDKILARRNMGNACAKALSKVHSQAVRDAVLHELARLWGDDPSLEGWAGFKDFDPEAFDMACGMASAMASDMAWGDAS